MALNGKFIVDNTPLSPLTFPGVGTFSAYSGDGIYRNRGGCTAVPNKGPIPAGRYWIVDRPLGGPRSRAQAFASDTWNAAFGAPSNHAEWFALFRDDSQIDDFAWINGVRRGQFRLHPSGGHGTSLGCITLPSHTDFMTVRRALLQTSRIPARNSGIQAYGIIEVVSNGNSCP